MLWPMATTDYLRRTGGVPAASWRRANSWWTHIYWEPTQLPWANGGELRFFSTRLLEQPVKIFAELVPD
jgi:hypothetical protein